MDSTLLAAAAGQLVDPATVLPDELVAEVFRKLHFPGRLSASHVCTLWRQIAVSDRCLWAEYGREYAKPSALAALLERSNPLPFCLVVKFGVPNTIAELVLANMARMKTLYLGNFKADDALQRILTLDIPVLKDFTSEHELHGSAPMIISPRWASAPHLERIQLSCVCVWPPDCVFPILRSYSGRVPEGLRPDAPLSQMFPNLSYLSLHHVTQVLLHRLVPLPPSLTTLKLQSADLGIGIDCTALLSSRPAPILRKLTINFTHNSSCVIEAVRLFEHCVTGPWRLWVCGGYIEVQDAPSNPSSSHFEVACLDHSLPTRIADLVPFCGRLSLLEHTLPDFLKFCSVDAVFPALSSIIISVSDEQDARIANSLRDMSGIRVPALQSLTLRTSRRVEQLIVGLLNCIVHCLCSPRLANIFAEMDNPNAFDHDEIAALLARAARLEFRTHAGEAVYVFS